MLKRLAISTLLVWMHASCTTMGDAGEDVPSSDSEISDAGSGHATDSDSASGESPASDRGTGTDTIDGADGGVSSDSDNDADADTVSNRDGGISGDAGKGDSDMDVCESVAVQAEVDPAYLAFAFDISGSMGAGDEPWHDQTLKWEPLTEATQAFLEDPGSAGFFASMTFFPRELDKCEDSGYIEPDVPMTALPSNVFGAAMQDSIADGWGGGTPTRHVMAGVLGFVSQSRALNPGTYVVVLVTDGYPTGCSDNSIDSVVTVAEGGVDLGIVTYIIGLNNPPIQGAPDTTASLGEIAAGGGTGDAFIIDTGDPRQTASDFASVIEQIRNSTIACTVSIPPPPDNRAFDKQKVRVVVTSAGSDTELVYNPSCDGDNAWRYDNPEQPSSIVLCDSTCTALQENPAASLSVEFACRNIIVIV